MFTVPKEELNEETEYWILEWTDEDGHNYVAHKGPGHINILGNGDIESVETGTTYHGCNDQWGSWHNMGPLDVWGDDYWSMAIFPDEDSMKIGAQIIIQVYGNDLSIGIYKDLIAL